MSLAERDKAGPPSTRQGLPCSVGTVLAALPRGEAEILRKWLADPRWTHEAIFRELEAEGHHVGRQSVGRHRKNECRCRAAH